MQAQATDVAIVGGGQAGLALSYRLTEANRTHLVLEQARVVESWRTKRWDSLRLIAPNWSLILPGFAYAGDDPDGFMGRDEVVERLIAYARSFGAPLLESVRVTSVEPGVDGGFRLQTTDGEVLARQVVLATGALQQPKLPPDAGEVPARITQLVAADYRNPGSLDDGAVLIVGSGETGVQIAEELARAGKDVWLSGGRSWWAPRRYRGRDIAAWLRMTGWFERLTTELPPGARAGQPNPQLTGAGGGHDINAHSLGRDGAHLLGRLRGMKDGQAWFADDLAANIAWADEEARKLLAAIDGIARTQELDVPEEELPPDLRLRGDETTSGPSELDLKAAGVRTVIWATGYRPDYLWVHLPFLDPDGYPQQRRGVTSVEGLYVLGLDWLHNAKSGLFAGIGDDASYLASVITARS